MENNKSNIRPTSCWGRSRYAGMQKSRTGAYKPRFMRAQGQKRGAPSSVRGFLGRLARDMEYGFATKYVIDLFIQGVIGRDEMLRKLDELEEKFNRKS